MVAISWLVSCMPFAGHLNVTPAERVVVKYKHSFHSLCSSLIFFLLQFLLMVYFKKAFNDKVLFELRCCAQITDFRACTSWKFCVLWLLPMSRSPEGEERRRVRKHNHPCPLFGDYMIQWSGWGLIKPPGYTFMYIPWVCMRHIFRNILRIRK